MPNWDAQKVEDGCIKSCFCATCFVVLFHSSSNESLIADLFFFFFLSVDRF